MQRLILWCRENYLQFNVKKNKDIVSDFRRNRNPSPPLTVNGETVKRVTTYKYCGVIIDEKLNWNENTVSVYKKCRQRLHFLSKLSKFEVSQSVLSTFYQAFCEVTSIVLFSVLP